MDKIKNISSQIKEKAKSLGFLEVGISKVEKLEKESQNLKQWLAEGNNADMGYMENHFEKRIDPAKLVEGAKSVISVFYAYYPKEKQQEGTYKISKYAYGKDYHYVLKDKLFELLKYINEEIHPARGRAFVDSAPVMDKVWAAKTGLGWIGKNTNLISKQHGSFFFIGELIIDLELEYDNPSAEIKNYCGNCTKCIDACPTGALKPYQMDARKCISYLTIEKKGDIPEEFKGKWEDWIFGCDICQDVCPWNKKVNIISEEDFYPQKEILEMTKEEWENLTESQFKELFKQTPLERTKYAGLMRNITFLKSKS